MPSERMSSAKVDEGMKNEIRERMKERKLTKMNVVFGVQVFRHKYEPPMDCVKD